uniref:C2H2-type domain-containing protein n=1 Tax=Megaviridae environmental sample TaxID=1737588 RepID=A0A5J6VLK4_9VIRU|nr:MAG: hypothetical protein [Megaviridae environmental sample]
MKYTCKHCTKTFSQKSHYDAHKNKKNSCIKCDKNFTTEWAYVNNELLHISKINKNSKNIKCKHGHPLIFCSGSIRRPYLKHKNSAHVTHYSEMSKWHCKWQGYFKNTEISFDKKDEQQIKNRRADVVLNDKYILEVQHSNITDSEVICRTDDYKLHDKELIWIIDGNTYDVKIDKFSDNSYLIQFDNNWKYKSFIYKYNFILLDINEQIYKIPVNSVCNKMFHAKSHQNIDLVIETLTNNPDNIWNLWKDENEIKPSLTIIQAPAGHGKTFKIWKNISENPDKELYIITTKQHTAKEVILNELNAQAERHEFHIVNSMDAPDNNTDREYYSINKSYNEKQYIVTYKHKHSNRECKVIIGTIDSFIYSLTSKSIGGNTFFEGLLNNICKNGCDKINKHTGQIFYAGEKIKLNKMTELWIDESQDLPINYYKAIIKLMLATKIDCVVVGDKLQSLEYEENFMTHIELNAPFINIIKKEPENTNRRIKVKYMAEKINRLVAFKNYNSPEIINELPDELEDRGESVLEIFTQKCIYANDTDKKKIDNEVEKILEKVKLEVDKYNYKPEDFLFLFPIMKCNILAGELETKLNTFWLERYGSDDEFNQYAVLHKHEEGQIIDTSKSTHASRIMSIRASKGDGRSVVFILNCTEQALKLLSNNKKNIVYESYFHVALTRAEYKIYFGLTYNNDDIHRRFAKIDENMEYIPIIKNSFTLDTITQYVDKEAFIKLIDDNKMIEEEDDEEDEEENRYSSCLNSSLTDWRLTLGRETGGDNDVRQYEVPNTSTTSNSSYIKENKNKGSCIIDWDYHCIRRAVYHNYAIFKIFEHSKNDELFEHSQIKVVLDKISKSNIIERSPKLFYDFLKNKDLMNGKNFPLCNLSHKKIYKTYYKEIKKSIETIQINYKNNPLSIGDLLPLDASILIYVIDVYMNEKHHQITPSTIYNIVNSFKKKDNIQELLEESENIKQIMENLMNKILKDKNIKWNIEHVIKLNGNTDDLILHNRYSLIGNNENNIHHIVFQTDYNKLNQYDTLIKLLLERFLILNANSNKREKNNKTRFSGKKIITYLIILKQNTYKIFDRDFEDSIDNQIIILCKNAFITYFKHYNKELFNYCKIIKSDTSNWKGFKSPYLFLAHEENFKKNSYIKNFFYELDKECKTDRMNVKNITDNFNLFEEKINEYIIEMCETYFGFNNRNDEDDDIEW